MNAIDVVAGSELTWLVAAESLTAFYEKCDYIKIFDEPVTYEDKKDAAYGPLGVYQMYRNAGHRSII